MPQMKIVVQVPMPCDKCKTKVLKIAAKARGVSSVSIEGDHLEVIGDDVDPVCLTRSLRKKLCCYSTLVQVGEVKPPVKTEEKTTKAPPAKSAPSATCVQYCCTPQFRPMYCELVHEYPEPTPCSIM